jgi:hypothetical protein
MLMTAHRTNSWLNLHWQQEAVHFIQRKEKHIVWTEVCTKGMMIPTSMKKDVAIRNVCHENDDSTDASDSHTKATYQKQERSQNET